MVPSLNNSLYKLKDKTCQLPDASQPMRLSQQLALDVDDPPDLTMDIKVPHSPRQSLEPPATQRKCGNCDRFGRNRTCPCNR
uniref:Uncharacterized protein n=1 Tax=Amphimedon queenslandica TaxID=400682 RepID=A0A1X7TT46_AMPQE